MGVLPVAESEQRAARRPRRQQHIPRHPNVTRDAEDI
jgi:hypothetical protein